MSSGADASDRDAALSRLSGPDLVAHLRTTSRRADYDAAARVLADRDRALAESEAALAAAHAGLVEMAAEVQTLKEGYLALKAARRGPRNPAPRADQGAEAAGPSGADDVVDLCGGSGDDDFEEGEFRPDAAGVSCGRKESAPEGEEGRRAGVSCKRKAPASASSSDDEDDKVPLSQLLKKRRGAQPGAHGEPKKRLGDVRANSAGTFGVDRPVISSVNMGEAVAEHRVRGPGDPKVAVFVQGTRNDRSGKNGGLSRSMPSPPPSASTSGNRPQKNSFKPDVAVGRAKIGKKQGPVPGAENVVPFQVSTPNPTDSARRNVRSARVCAEAPMDHTGPSSDGTNSMGMVHKSIKGQGETIVGVQMTKVPLETNGTGEKVSTVLRAIREQGKPNDQLLKTKVLPGTNGIGEKEGKLSPCQSREDTDGGRPRTSDKPLSATLQRNNQLVLHSEQMTVESSLPSAVTRQWKCSSDLLTSCIGNTELCMQAVCALHRQRKLTTQPTERGSSGCTELSKIDAHRAAVLAEFLLDGNLQGPLKRTAEDLVKHDSAGPDLLETVVLQCCEKLFSIYRNKDDKYFR